jgi:hypothetical protein
MTKKEKIPATVRNTIWCKYIGELDYSKCFCCNHEPITRGNFECGHVISEKKGGKVHLDNLRPICSLCNRSMGIENMEHFMEKFGYEKNENWYGEPTMANMAGPALPGIDNKKVSNENHITNHIPIKPKPTKKISNSSINDIFVNKINKNKLIIFLDDLSLKQLQQLCLMLNLKHCGTKNKLKQRIITEKYTFSAITKKIHDIRKKKYFVECYRFEPCSDHDEHLPNCGRWVDCNNCKSFYHVNFTNDTLLNKLSNKKYISKFKKMRIIFDVDNIKCDVCDNISFMEEHDNEFYENEDDENDDMEYFLQKNYKVTNNDFDRIHKDDFVKHYQEFYNLNEITWKILINDVKRLGLEYDRMKQINNKRGVILGLIRK